MTMRSKNKYIHTNIMVDTALAELLTILEENQWKCRIALSEQFILVQYYMEEPNFDKKKYIIVWCVDEKETTIFFTLA